jgi:hypothetical protein
MLLSKPLTTLRTLGGEPWAEKGPICRQMGYVGSPRRQIDSTICSCLLTGLSRMLTRFKEEIVD